MHVNNITLAHVAAALAARYGKQPKSTHNGYQSHCPCHDDQTGSLSLSVEKEKLLVHCQAGCDQDAVWAEVTKLSPAKSSDTGKTGRCDRKIVAVYPYQDADGNAIFEKVRYAPKAFSQRREDGNGGYIFKLEGVDTTIPYRLPAVREAIKKGDPIYCAEGEKDCDYLGRLGLCATCNAQGASQDGKKPKWTDGHTAWLVGASEVVILPDNDGAGRAHAEAIAKSLFKAGISCRILELPDLKTKGDVSDWLDAGGTRDDLLSLANAAPHWAPQESDEAAEEPSSIGAGSINSSDNSGNPWSIKAPAGFHLTADSVLYFDTTGENAKYKKVFGPCWVVAETRRGTKDAWGKAIRWIDRDGNTHERAIPAGRFHEQGNALAQELAEEGLAIVPGQERTLVKYLGTFETKARQQAVEKLGWLDTAGGELCYVTPTQVLRKKGNESGNAKSMEDIVFQPERYSPTTTTMTASGSLSDWKEHVAVNCSGQPFLIFSLCTSLAGPLLKHARLDSGGFHFYGRSSHGKTTLAQVGASVWGCGADPADAPEAAFIRKWNSTANALEGLAAAHTDGVMILDELQSCAAKDFGSVIYNLFGGQGKSAMDASRNLKKQRAWRILSLSTGEISSKQKIEETP